MTRRIVLTGATGFIGRHVAARLLAGGDVVVAIVRPESAQQPPPGVEIARTALDAAGLRRACAGADAVVHLAGVVSSTREADYAEVNIEGSRAMADAAAGAGARLVHVSSLAAAGPAPASAPRSEDDPPAPVTTYGWSKLESERAVMGVAGLTWTILRPGVVYGPGDRAVLLLFQYARRGLLPLVGNPETAYTFVHVSDVVRAIDAALAGRGTGSAVFVGHPEPATSRGILEEVRAAVNPHALILPIPVAVARVAASVGELAGRLLGRPMPIDRRRFVELTAPGFVCRVDRLRDSLGVIPAVGLREGLQATAAWYKEEGWL